MASILLETSSVLKQLKASSSLPNAVSRAEWGGEKKCMSRGGARTIAKTTAERLQTDTEMSIKAPSNSFGGAAATAKETKVEESKVGQIV
jgi:hypothetical protein